jgi:hypothetical protein
MLFNIIASIILIFGSCFGIYYYGGTEHIVLSIGLIIGIICGIAVLYSSCRSVIL